MESSTETTAAKPAFVDISSDEDPEVNSYEESMSIEVCPAPQPFIPPPSTQASSEELSANEMARIHKVVDELKEEINNRDVVDDLGEDRKVVLDLVIGKIDVKVAAKTITDAYYTRMYRRTATQLPDPGKFKIPVNIEGVDFKGMCDLSSHINWMTEDTFNALEIKYLKRRRMTIAMTDGAHNRCLGVTTAVTVKVGKFLIPTDFWILSFDMNPQDPFILGRRFLKTSGAIIDVLADTVQIRVGGEEVTFDMKEYRDETEGGNDFETPTDFDKPIRSRKRSAGNTSTQEYKPS